MNKTLGAIALALVIAQAAPVAVSAHTGVAALSHLHVIASHQRSVKKMFGCGGGGCGAM